MSSNKSEYVYGLDVFRSIAILLVLMGHSFEHSQLPPWVASYGRIGSLGVELFFVLSGFLIGSIIIKLIDAGRFNTFTDIRHFWMRRWLRTIPLYVVILLAFLRFDYHGRHALTDYPQYFFFMQNFAWKLPEFFDLSWSLAVEEHFYFWFPLLYLLFSALTKRPIVALLLTALSFLCITVLFRASFPLFTDWNDFNRTIRLSVLSRIDALMFGVGMAVIKRHFPSAFVALAAATPFWMIAFLLLCCWYYLGVPGIMSTLAAQVGLFTLQSLLCSLLLPWFDSLKEKPDTGFGEFFATTSRLAYSLYLVHILVIIAVNTALGRLGLFEQVYPNAGLLYLIYFPLYYFVAWITYSTIERPFMQLREYSPTTTRVTRTVAPAFCAIAYLVFFA